MEVRDGIGDPREVWGEGDLQEELQPLLPGGGAGTGSACAEAILLCLLHNGVMIFYRMLGATRESFQECC